MVKFYNVLFALAATLSASAADSFFVTPAPLPDMVKNVYPEQGLVEVSGSTNPLGVKQITIAFASKEVVVNENAAGEFLLYKEGETAPVSSLPANKSYLDAMTAGQVGFEFPGTFLDNGIYHVDIPAGAWTVGGESVPAFRLNYEIFRSMVVLPRSGYQKELSTFRVEFPGASEVVASGLKADCYKDASLNEWDIDVKVEGVGATLTIVGGPVKGEGTYGLNLPKGMFKITYKGHPGVEGDTRETTINSEEVLMKYSMSEMPAPAVSPAEGVVPGFDKFTFSYPAGFELWFVNDREISYIYKILPEGDLAYEPLCKLKTVQTEKGFELQVINSDYEPEAQPLVPADGAYLLQLSQGLLFGVFNGSTINSASYEYVYHIGKQSGITSPAVTPQPSCSHPGVYNLYGVKVAESIDTLSASSLPAGIYICNGRKIAVR